MAYTKFSRGEYQTLLLPIDPVKAGVEWKVERKGRSGGAQEHQGSNWNQLQTFLKFIFWRRHNFSCDNFAQEIGQEKPKHMHKVGKNGQKS